MTSGPPDPWSPAAAEDPSVVPSGDVLEGGMEPPRWRRRWAGLPRRARLLAGALVVLVAAGAGGLVLRDRAADRAQARRVDLTASMSVSSLSATPPGGQVSFFVTVRNEGTSPVWVTDIDGSAPGLRLRRRDDIERQVAADGEAAVPVSVRLTCSRYRDGEGLTAAVTVRRADGSTTSRRVRPDPADPLLGVATTLCRARPDLHDQELSGPVLASGGRADAERN